MASTLFGPIPGLSYLVASHAWDNSLAIQTIASAANPPPATAATATTTAVTTQKRMTLPQFTIIHGDRDGIVPHYMGKQLATEVETLAPRTSYHKSILPRRINVLYFALVTIDWKSRFQFISIPRGDHNTIFRTAYPIIAEALLRTPPDDDDDTTAATAAASKSSSTNAAKL
jgi:hypothetical protein